MGEMRSFEQFWDGLYPETQKKMNKADASFIWMCRASDIKKAEMLGRHQALNEIIDRFEMEEMYSSANFVHRYMQDDRSFDFFNDKK